MPTELAIISKLGVFMGAYRKHLLNVGNLLAERSLFLLEPRQRLVDGIYVLPWQDFLESLWSDEFVGDFRNG
jgi:hypothetical protein